MCVCDTCTPYTFSGNMAARMIAAPSSSHEEGDCQIVQLIQVAC